MSVGIVYFLSFVVGLGYSVVVGLSSHFFGGHDADVHMDVGTDLPISPLSPTVIATFLTGFGGGGLLAYSYFQVSVVKSVAAAVGTGLLLSAGTFLALSFLFKNTQAGSEYSVQDMVGRIVQVITPIPENGTGEVAMIVKGTRIVGPARTADGSAVTRNAAVEITQVVGNVYYVRDTAPASPDRKV